MAGDLHAISDLKSQFLEVGRKEIGPQGCPVGPDYILAYGIFISDFVIVDQPQMIGVFEEEIGGICTFIIVGKLSFGK